jgi:putative transposase
MPLSEHDLDVCLMKSTERTIQLYGCIEFECIVYGAGWSKDEKGLWRYNKDEDFLKDYEGKVVLRYNPSNIVYLYVYTKEVNGQPSRYLGTIRAKHSQERDLYRDEERLSLKEWRDRKKMRSEESKSVDQSSILAEQRDLTKFSNEKVEEHKKSRRKRKTREVKKDEQARITRNSKQSNVIEFPSANSPSDDTRQRVENSQPKADTTPEAKVAPTSKRTKIEAKPALFVVQDLNKFMESDW